MHAMQIQERWVGISRAGAASNFKNEDADLHGAFGHLVQGHGRRQGALEARREVAVLDPAGPAEPAGHPHRPSGPGRPAEGSAGHGHLVGRVRRERPGGPRESYLANIVFRKWKKVPWP